MVGPPLAPVQIGRVGVCLRSSYDVLTVEPSDGVHGRSSGIYEALHQDRSLLHQSGEHVRHVGAFERATLEPAGENERGSAEARGTTYAFERS